MEILEAFDLTGSLPRRGASWRGVRTNTVAPVCGRAGRRAAGAGPRGGAAELIDAFLAKLEEWVDRSKGKIRADVAHDKLVAMGYTGSERTTRRAVARGQGGLPGRAAAGAPAVGARAGDVVAVRLRRRPAGRRRCRRSLFCAWLAWCRFRVVLPMRDKTAAQRVRRDRRDAAPVRRGADLPADRQREDGHRRARRRDRGAQPGRWSLRPATTG